MKRISRLTIPFVLFFSGHATAGLFGGPNNYDECIIEKMKDIDQKTWRLIIEPSKRVCERKFKLNNHRL